MAQTVHLTLKINGEVIEGESTQVHPGRENTIECFSLEGVVTCPIDPATGQTTGRREYKPVKIRKRIDKSSPQIAEALGSGVMCEAMFEFFRPSKDGSDDEVYFSIQLVDANVAGLRQCLPDLMGSPSADFREAYEEVEFTFDRITWFHKASSKGASDSWSGKE